MQERTLESCLGLLRVPHCGTVAAAAVLQCTGTLLAHRRVAELVGPPDLDAILAVPTSLHTAGDRTPHFSPARVCMGACARMHACMRAHKRTHT